MAGYVYLCPDTGVRIQAFTAEAITSDPNTYEPVTCIMCRKVHHVNPFTGKVLGVGDDAQPENVTAWHAARH
jgi:hypothetical protein